MRVKIKEICEINPKQEVLDDESIISFVGMAQISNDNKFDTSILKKYKDVKKGFSSFKNGDILFAKITPCMENGKGVLIENLYNETGFGSTEFHVLRVNSEIVSKKYLYWFTKWKTFRLNCEKNMTGSAGQKRVPKNYIENYELNLPKLFVQEKRVKILDCLLEIKQKKLQKLVELENLSKCLFIKMFGNIILNDKNWKTQYWKNVLEIKNGKNQRKVENKNGKYPIYGSGGIIGFADDYLCKENSVIIGRKGNINKPIIVFEKFWNVDTAFGLEPNDEILSVYYLYYFCREYNFEIHNKAVTIPSLVKGDLEKIKIPIPPIELQNKFAERIKLIEKSKFTVIKNFKLVLNIQNYLFYTS